MANTVAFFFPEQAWKAFGRKYAAESAEPGHGHGIFLKGCH
jgi:uncharacterized membrane protein